MVKHTVNRAFQEGKSVRDISYFLLLCLGKHIGKDCIYKHYREHDTDSYSIRVVYQQTRSSKNKRSYPKRTSPVDVLEAMKND